MDVDVAFLNGTRQEPRLLEVTCTLCAEMLQLGGLAADTPQTLQQVDHALHSGQARERPASYLTPAPVQQAVLAPRSGWITGMATWDIGLQLIELDGGRRVASDALAAQQSAQVLQRLVVLRETAPPPTPALLLRIG